MIRATNTDHLCLRVFRANGRFYPTIRDRFDSYVEQQADGCHVWTGARNHKGYGIFRSPAGSVLAHRWNYEATVGAVPVGLQTDHLCRNRACVNVEHLEPVTPRENTHRGSNYSPDVCKRDHLKVNPIVSIRGNWKSLVCRTCATEHKRRARAARKEQTR